MMRLRFGYLVGLAFATGCSGSTSPGHFTQAGAVLNGAVLNGGVLNGAVLNGAVLNGAVLNGGVINVDFSAALCGSTNSIDNDGICLDGTQDAIERLFAAGERIPSYIGCWATDPAGPNRWCGERARCVTLSQINDGYRPWGTGNSARPFSQEWNRVDPVTGGFVYQEQLDQLRQSDPSTDYPTYPDMDGVCVRRCDRSRTAGRDRLTSRARTT